MDHDKELSEFEPTYPNVVPEWDAYTDIEELVREDITEDEKNEEHEARRIEKVRQEVEGCYERAGEEVQRELFRVDKDTTGEF